MKTTVFSSNTEFYEQNFSSLSYPSIIIEDKLFEGCRFINANFSESQFIRCKFVDCEFNNCNLSAVQFKASSLNNVTFFESKVTGVNWTMLNWPHIRLSSPFQFYNSIISHSSFYGLELQELIIEACIAHDVDFREADLRRANFKLTDFEKSQFVHTKLYASDFTEAHSYSINPTQNDIKKAKFSLPDAIHLLDGFEIQIIG
ncbi:pentapeptide repeat-containing protein [Legionella sp. PATHC038]|uniref:pentapeptide repeat-containing protein n=1 Tax=Legionella sheltonii TaxID=2992041 RepID=UPI002244F44A|nr:pentapeptide repeat-containing protein [Legionella sp. PATHC038]MCW8399480.1 pentapeptide repeat-containing protein [Legionella sp. PATHC038]MCW8400904.1 pentapeptide repeat-containing protein [Legionella sp. PATHC038]